MAVQSTSAKPRARSRWRAGRNICLAVAIAAALLVLWLQPGMGEGGPLRPWLESVGGGRWFAPAEATPVAASPGSTQSIAIDRSGRAELGRFAVSRFDPVTESRWTVVFKLSGRLAEEAEASFGPWVAAHPHWLREQITMTIRDCSASDLANAEALNRKLAARLNRALGSRSFRSVEVAGLEVYEMPAVASPSDGH